MRVVITGASSGIGEALARHCASPDTVLGLISRRAATPALAGKAIPVPTSDGAGKSLVMKVSNFHIAYADSKKIIVLGKDV